MARRMLIALLAALALALATTPRAQAQSTVISACTNDSALRTAVAAGGTQTITFNCGVATIPISSFMAVPNGSQLVIDGANQITLDGRDAVAFFQVFADAQLLLRNLTLTGGAFTGVHALENFGVLTLESVVVTGNVSDGSAITNSGSLTIRDSTLSGNGVEGAPVDAVGAALTNVGGNTLIERSSFSSNVITGTLTRGGAIANSGGTTTVVSTTFSANRALDGGAIYVGAGTSVTVTGSVFDSNQAGYGGAIEMAGSRLLIERSQFTNNRATTGDGGALWVLSGTLAITDSLFAANQATTTGGAISCFDSALSIAGSTFAGNRTIGGGGAIYSSCTLALSNSTMSGNQATGTSAGGGAIFHTGARSGVVSFATIADNAARFGAGVYRDGDGGGTLTVSASILSANATGNCDGVVASGGFNLTSDTNCGGFTQPGDRQGLSLALSALGSFGGRTPTRLLIAGNPAIDAIPAAQCASAADQRGLSRPLGAGCDSGAVELRAPLRFLPLLAR
jgi:predicted outer membrane repeat protein